MTNLYPLWSKVVSCWWSMYNSIQWPDTLAMNLVSYLPGGGERRTMRRYIIRLVNLSAILCLRSISSSVARRFPTYDHLIQAGQLLVTEFYIC